MGFCKYINAVLTELQQLQYVVVSENCLPNIAYMDITTCRRYHSHEQQQQRENNGHFYTAVSH